MPGALPVWMSGGLVHECPYKKLWEKCAAPMVWQDKQRLDTRAWQSSNAIVKSFPRVAATWDLPASY